MNDNLNYYIPFEQEIYRKMIHLMSLSMPIIYLFITKELALQILIPITLIDIIVEILYKTNNSVRRFIDIIFGKMLRPNEKKNKFVFTGATWVFISASLTISIFPKFIAINALTILIISDISAALFGRKFGKTKFLGKSLEGSLAFTLSAYLVILLYGYIFNTPWTFYLFGFFSAIAGAIFEASSRKLKIDDNLTIPLSVSIILWIGDALNLSSISYMNIL